MTGARHQILLAVLVGCGLGALAAAFAAGHSTTVVLAVTVVLAASSVPLVGDLRRVLLGLVMLNVPFQWDQYFGYRQDVDYMAAVAGWSVSATTLALAALYAMWIAHALVSPKTAWRPRLQAAAFPLIFLAILTASLAVANDPVVGSFQVVMYAQMLLLFVYIASTLRTRDELRFLVTMLLVALCLESVVTLLMWGTGARFQLPGLSVRTAVAAGSDGARVAGTMFSANNAGAYFAFMFALAATLYLSRVDARLRRLALVSCVLALLPLGLTLSRGAWIACVASIVVIFLGSRGTRLSGPAMVALALTMIIVLIPLYDVVATRLTTTDEGAAAGRVPLMVLALDMVRDHPLLGVGANNFVLELPGYAGGRFASAWLSSVHHKYLLIWSEAGPGALVAFVLFIGSTISRGWRARRSEDPLVAAVGLGLAAAVAGHAVHMNFDIFSSGTPVQLLWIGAAIVACPVLAVAPRPAAARAAAAIRSRPAVPVPRSRRTPA